MDSKGLVNFREKACDTNECVEPESISTQTFYTSPGTNENTLPCHSVSFPVLPLALVLAFDLVTEVDSAKLAAGRLTSSELSGQSLTMWLALPHQKNAPDTTLTRTFMLYSAVGIV